jgi:predicted  nucleic acid-binding Zn-ribbon protein
MVAFCLPFRYSLVQGGFLMKKRLVVLFAIALCLLATMPGKSAWAADPGSRYADAFVLIEQGQAAEEKSDLATAYHNYQSALSTLHTIRTDSPDWNAQMVEYRLKDCQSRFDAVKAKLPEPPPAPAAAALVGSTVTPVVEAPPAPPAPAVTPPAPPPAPVVKAATADQSAKLKSEIDKLEAENHQLKSDLTDAKRAARSNSQADTLARENKDLKVQLAAAEKKAAAVKPVPAPVVVDSGEAKKLRADLVKANAEIDRLKKASAESSQNFAKGTSPVIASPVVAAPPSDSAEMKKLRAELNKTRTEADAAKKSAAQVPDLQKQNKDLSAKLASTEKKTNIAPTDSSEVKNLRTELDKSHAEVADLKKQVAAKPVLAPVPVADNSEVKSLRTQVSDLQRQNKDLNAKLAAAAAKPAPVDNSAELKKLRTEADGARADADKARKAAADLEKQNKDLSAKLAGEKKAEAEAPTVAPDARVMKQLRNENSYLRNLLDTYAEQNSELKGQLRRHDQNQSKSGQ